MKNVFLLALVCLVMCSCRSSKEAALKDLRGFRNELVMSSQFYDAKDWKHAVEDYKKINQKLKKHAVDYNSAEMEEIGVLQGECVAAMGAAVKDKATGLAGLLQGMLQGLGLDLQSLKNLDLDMLKSLLLGK